MEAGTVERKDLDPDVLAKEAATERGDDEATEDDGTGVPGGALPQDDVIRPDEPPVKAVPDPEPADVAAESPPTPPADLPDDGGDLEEEPQAQLFLTGSRALGVKVGGKKPESSVLKYKGGKVDLDGQFDLEDRVLTVDVWQVTGDNVKHTIEKATGAVKSSGKAQEATLCATVRIEDWLEDRLGEDDDLADRAFAALELDRPAAA